MSEEFNDWLDFERPILEIDRKIEELQSLAASQDVDHQEELDALRQLREKLTKKIFEELTPWQRVRLARHPQRPLSSDYIDEMFERSLELHGDRLFGDDPAIATAFAMLGDRRVLVVGHRKGRTTSERIKCFWGCAHPEGYRKALHKMRLAEKFGLPIVTLVDTPGAYPGIGAEERGQAAAIARNIMEMSSIRVPIVSVVIGEGGSGGALGIGVADHLMILENAYYSVISPEGCAAILWKDAAHSERAAEALKLTSRDLHRLGIMDEVVEEPLGGAHRDPSTMMVHLKERILEKLGELSTLPVEEMLEKRYQKYRTMGPFQMTGQAGQ